MQHEKMLFNRIDTEAVVRGQKITSSFVYRTQLADYDEYERVSTAHFRAYPGLSYARVTGWPVGTVPAAHGG